MGERKEAKEKAIQFTEAKLAEIKSSKQTQVSKAKMEEKAPTLPLQNPVEHFKDPPKNSSPPGPVPANPNPTPGPSQVAKNLPTSAGDSARSAKRNPKNPTLNASSPKQ